MMGEKLFLFASLVYNVIGNTISYENQFMIKAYIHVSGT